MVKFDNKHLLFIEPKNKFKEQDILDEITIYFESKFNLKESRNDFTKGWHTCSCKEHSTNVTYNISLGGKSYITNSLALHYLKNHRSEVPIDTLNLIINSMNLDNSNSFKRF